MATDSALTVNATPLARFRVPDRIPDLGKRGLIIFQLLWLPALLLAVVGPIGGLWYRFDQAGQNSALIVGSRAGLALSEDDLTRVRFPIGSAAKAAGVRPGDDIVAIEGLRVARIVPISPGGLARPHDATDTDYALFSPIIEGVDESEYTIRLRSKDETEHDFTTKLGEQHIAQATQRFGLPPVLLNFVDLLHLITYPFLLFAAWILHRRKPEDLISSVLSLAILLTMAAEQPSAGFLAFVLHVSDWAHRLIYDLGNLCLLAGVLLFPFGQLKPRYVLLPLAMLPMLFVLSGDWYRTTFALFMLIAVTILFRRVRETPPGDGRQQIKWALFGFSGYAVFLAAALGMDAAKLHVSSFGSQMLLELLAGLSFGLAFLILQLGLLVALLRFRLYDAEAVISRSANFAIITLGVAALFAATADGLKQIILNYYGNTGSTAPVVFAAAVATVVISPLQEHIQRWSEKRFQRNLVMLRDELPEVVRELRETDSVQDLLDETLKRIETGVRTKRMVVLLDGDVAAVRGIARDEVAEWLKSFDPVACQDDVCSTLDRVFPIRVPLQTKSTAGDWIGWLLVGPRPDGSILSKDEQRALVDVAGPITMALRIASRREDRENMLERRIAVLEAHISTQPAKGVRKRLAVKPGFIDPIETQA